MGTSTPSAPSPEGALESPAAAQTDETVAPLEPSGPSQTELIQPINLDGSGATLTDEFRLEEGPLVVALTHDGSSNFAVWLKNSKGKDEELLVNTIGSYEGSRGIGVFGDDYVFDVDADGAWTIEVTQPYYDGGYPLPHSFKGLGDTATEPFEITESSLVRVELAFSGKSNFAIWLFDADGNQLELVVNEIGSYKGSTGLSLDAGVYFLDVTADGKWSVKAS